jgi:quercetin dioxygenase-like cupin family protein
MRFSPALSLAAVVLALACSNGEATSPKEMRVSANRQARHDGSVSSVVIPAVGGFTPTTLAHGSFSDEIVLTFRIKEDGRTTVVKVDDPSEMITGRITIVPGGALPWHSHPGPVLVTVASGELTVVESHGCEVRRYGANSSFMDVGQGHVHSAFNAGSTDVVLYATYLDVPPGQSPLSPAENPGC